MATKVKFKSHKALLKRVKVTGRGKVKFHASNSGHLRSGKSPKRLRNLRKARIAKRGDMNRLEKLLNRRLVPVDEVRTDRKCCGGCGCEA
jgi:large subunit ribosomal protein L35